MNRILLIEDDPGAQILYRNRLTDLGYEVVLSSTGAMGLMEARSGPFDLFLVDIGLGSGIDGYEVCRRLKTIPEIHAVPVVLISGHVKVQEDLHRGYEAGCQSFLVKGDLVLLEDIVRAMLRIKSLQDDLALQNRLLEDHNRRLEAEQARNADLTQALSSRSGRAGREQIRPDGMLLVDGEGVVWTSDRGAREIFGQAIDGKQLSLLAPASRLEAFVRNTRTAPHESIRFEVPERPGRAARQLLVSVYPFMPRTERTEPELRAILLFDAAWQGSSPESGRGEPRRGWAPLVEAAREVFRPGALLGTSAVIRDLRKQVAQAARSDEPLLLRGPAGSGKSFVARILHYSSARPGAFVEIACGAFGASQLAQELFGSESVPGAFHHAQGGTLHLQDADRLPAALQERLLEALRHGRPGGGAPAAPEMVDVRIVASTSSAPDGALLRHLAERTLAVPGLKERPEDVEALSRHVVARHARFEDACFTPDAARVLARHDWPGNVRELEGVVQSACQAATKAEIELSDLPHPLSELLGKHVRQNGTRGAARPLRPDQVFMEREIDTLLSSLDSTVSLLDAYEKGALLHALRLKGGDKLAAAKLLRVGKSTFYRKLKQHGIT